MRNKDSESQHPFSVKCCENKTGKEEPSIWFGVSMSGIEMQTVIVSNNVSHVKCNSGFYILLQSATTPEYSNIVEVFLERVKQ